MTTTVSLVTPAEELFMDYKQQRTGSGYTALINAIFALDMNHRNRMAKGFPELVEVVNRYGNERGYWKDLVRRYNEENGTQIVP